LKKKLGVISGGSAALFGMALSRWAREHYGIKGSLFIALVCLIVLIVILIISACISKKYLATMTVFLMISPIIVSIVGIYLNNIYMMIGGLVLFFVSGVFMNKKVLPKFKDRK
jgi:hypothetical protein